MPKPHRVRYHPNFDQAKSLLKKKPHAILLDKDGRLYGRLPKSELLTHLAEDADFDETRMFACWVMLPYRRKGPFASKDNPAMITEEDALQLPELESTIRLYNYVSKHFVGEVVVVDYPERIIGEERTTSVILKKKNAQA